MRKGLLILRCIIGVSLGFSQTADPKVQLGVAFGGNISNLLSNDPALNAIYDWRMRFFAGVSQQTLIGKHFLIRTEINYQGLGTSYKVQLTDGLSGPASGGRYQYGLHYLQLPVLFKARFGKSIKGYVEGGPYIGLLLTAKEGLDENPNDLFNFPNLIVSQKFHTFDTGIIFGGGIEIPVFNEHVFLFGVRYYQGFLDVTREDAREWNGAFNFHVGYLFQI